MDLRDRLKQNIQNLNTRRDARPQSVPAQRDGTGVSVNGNRIRARSVSNEALGTGDAVVFSGDSGMVQQERRRVTRAVQVGRPIGTKDGILILVEHYSTTTEKWTYSLGGDRPLQQIYEHPVRLQAVINPVLEVGKTKDSWSFHGVIITQNLPYIYKIKVVTVTPESTVLSPEINAWTAIQSIHYLGSGAWNINIVPYPTTINTAVPDVINALDPPIQEEIVSVGELYSGFIAPTDPFRRIVTATGNAPRIRTSSGVVPLSEVTQASGASLGGGGLFFHKKTITIATTVDCGLGVEVIELDNTATCNIVSTYVKGATIEQSTGVSNTFRKYRARKERDLFCASTTLYSSDQDFLGSTTLSLGPSSLIYLTQELKIDYQWTMKFSDSFPVAQRSGDRSSIYNGVTNTEVAYTKLHWDFPVATFNSGTAYLGYKVTLDVPEIRVGLNGTVMPIALPTSGSDPNSIKFFFDGGSIEPTFPTNPTSIPIGEPYDFNDFFLTNNFNGTGFRDLKNWRIEAGEIQIDKISELPRDPNTSAVRVVKTGILTEATQAVYSYRLLTDGTFEKTREKRVSVVPVTLSNARFVNALYYPG